MCPSVHKHSEGFDGTSGCGHWDAELELEALPRAPHVCDEQARLLAGSWEESALVGCPLPLGPAFPLSATFAVVGIGACPPRLFGTDRTGLSIVIMWKVTDETEVAPPEIW